MVFFMVEKSLGRLSWLKYFVFLGGLFFLGPAWADEAVPTATCPTFFTRQNLCAGILWSVLPPHGEKGQFTIRFWQPENGSLEKGPFIDPQGQVGVELWRPQTNHAGPNVVIARVENGVYQVTRVYFFAAGVWDIRLQIKKDGKIDEQVVIPVTIGEF